MQNLLEKVLKYGLVWVMPIWRTAIAVYDAVCSLYSKCTFCTMWTPAVINKRHPAVYSQSHAYNRLQWSWLKRCIALGLSVMFLIVSFVFLSSIYDVQTGERGQSQMDARGCGKLCVNVHKNSRSLTSSCLPLLHKSWRFLHHNIVFGRYKKWEIFQISNTRKLKIEGTKN